MNDGDWVLYPWFEENGVDLVHPDDIDRLRKLGPYGKVFVVGDRAGEFQWIRYGDVAARVKPSLAKPVAAPAFRFGQEARSKSDQRIGKVVDIQWHHAQNRPFFHLSFGEKKSSRRFWAEELEPLATGGTPTIEYRAGSEFAPYPVGQTLLRISADGVATLEHRHQGKREVWQGRVLPEALAAFVAALGQSQFPVAQQWPMPPPGETMRHLTVGGAKPGAVMVPWHAAMKASGYADAFRILDEIIGQLSGGAVRVVKDAASSHVAEAHRVE